MKKRILSFALLAVMLVFLLPISQSSAVALPQDSSADIRVMSANVRAEFASWSSDGVAPEATSTRVLKLAKMLEENNPMIVATQEMSPTWYTAFQKLDSAKWAWLEESDVAGYSYYNFVPNKGLALNSILYRKDLLTLQGHGVEAYTTRSNGQCIVWGVFTITATGKQCVVISTHWTPGADKANERLAQAEQLAKKVNSFRQVYGDTVIVMGDFNCNDETQEFRRFLVNSNSVDSRPGATTRGDSLNKIDHITATADASFTYHTICYEANNAYAISDHPFAVADIKLSSALMFDFTDNADSRYHYKQGAYRSNAYDYHLAYWRHDTTRVSNMAINKSEGTLSFNVSATGNPYIIPSTNASTEPNKVYGLNFNPSTAEVAKIRFRLTNCALIDTATSPSVSVSGVKQGNATWVSNQKTYSLDKANAAYQTLTISLTDSGLRSLTQMEGLRVMFNNIKNGSVTIDYIYVGPNKTSPQGNALFFDYSNTAQDQSRYAGTSYGGYNYDKDYWTTAGYGTTTDFTINNTNGTATVNIKNKNTLGPIFATAPSKGSYQWNANGTCLNYTPSKAEFLQIRFKLDNCTTVSGKNSRLLLVYGGLYNGVYDGDNWENVVNYSYTNGQYLILTMPLSDTFRQAEKITQIGVRFQYVESSTNGTATIDYLYIGPEAGLPTKHVYNVKTVKATCTTDGYTTHTCRTCAYAYTDNQVKAAGHKEVTDKAVAATCTTAGKTAGSHCSVCNTVIKAQTTVAATGHSYTYKATKNPTTSATGTLTGTCSKCSGTTTVSLPKLNTTDYTKTVTKAATCTATGTDSYKWKTTTYGSFTFTATTAALGHSYTAKVTAPTCTAQGYTTHTCSRCSDSYKDTYTNATGHSYTYKATKNPTTSATGTLTGTCSKCSGTTTVSLPKLNTTDYTKTVTKAATCTATGTDSYKWKTTTYGSFTFTATTAALGHSYTTKVTAPTCTAQGYTTHTCSRCSDSYKDTYTNATGHSYSSKVTTVATCTKAGVKTFTCSKCNHSYTEAIAATGHTPVTDKAVAATCTTAGKTEGSHCSVCNAVIKAQTTIPATGHSYTSKVTTAATCTKAGVKTYTCSKCNHSYTEAIAATGHTPVTDKAIAATCTTDGKTEGSHCSVCNAVIKAQTTVPATGHSYGSKVTTAATCTKAGVKTFTCSKCNHSYTEAIAATGHTPVTDKAVAATCTTAGKTEGSHCSVCNAVIKAQTTVPSLGHDYKYTDNGDGTHTGTCTRCEDLFTENHKFEGETCFCGAKVLTLDENIKIYHTLDLASDISITFAVPQTTLASYDSYYLEVVLPEYEGNVQTGTSTVQIQPVVNGKYYYFTLTGITAVRMGDLIDATLHMTRGTARYISVVDSYSVATYAYGMLNSTTDSKMLTLCADLLRYGAEAQSFKGYRTDSLVDASMTEAQRAYLSDTETLTFTATDSYLGDLATPVLSWVGKTLDLGSKVGMKFVFNAKNYSGNIENLSMKVSYKGSNGEAKTVTLTGAEVYSAANKYYSFTFYGLLASELRTVVDVAVYEGNTQLTQALRYSAESYASKNTTGALGALCKALFAYSDSARTFFGSAN